MAATLKGISATASATPTAIYTATTSTAILSIIAACTGSSSAIVTVGVYRTATATETQLISNLSVPAASNVNVYNGKVILNAGDELRLSGGTTIDVHLALSEVN